MPFLSKVHTYFRYLWNGEGIVIEILNQVNDDFGYLQATVNYLLTWSFGGMADRVVAYLAIMPEIKY